LLAGPDGHHLEQHLLHDRPGTRARSHPRISAPPRKKALVGGVLWSEERFRKGWHGTRSRVHGRRSQALLHTGWSTPRVIQRPAQPSVAVDQHQSSRTIRMRRREDHRHRPALADSDHGRAIRAGIVHDGQHVVGPLLHRGQLDQRDRSESPTPRLSNMRRRPIAAIRCRNRAIRGSSQRTSTWPLHSGMNTTSGGPSPTAWYATCNPPRLAY
jgi:regulator of extracellular matrix RemA (YlzA/DUF370 family)